MKRLGFNLIAMIGCFVVGLVAVLALSFIQLHPKANVSPSNVLTNACPTERLRGVLLGSQIRQIDFLNFTYPIRSSSYKSVQNTIKLVNGDFEFYNPKENFQ